MTENNSLSVRESLKPIIKFEQDINDFLLDMQNSHFFEGEEKILASAWTLRKRISKMRQFRESFK